jgi:hypothetical protein
LAEGAPGYAGNNDFARFEGKTYVVFPPFPALLLLPLVYIGKTPERVQDGQFFLWLSGIAPAVLFLVLEKLRRLELSARSERQHVVLALLFAFGTVYFFTAEQGTVWYAAHVVGAALCASFALFALGAERPALAGIALGLAVATRPPLLFASVLFVAEAFRQSLKAGASSGDAPPASRHALWCAIDTRGFLGLLGWFLLPVLCIGVLLLAYNAARFGHPFESGYRYLDVAWRARIEKWGLFSYHYLARNLGVLLTSLPWYDRGANPALMVSGHGLALWVTSPIYLWLVWPKAALVARRALVVALYLTVLAVALPTLLYQNTGWVQFGYRFSNDYAVFLFVLLALQSPNFSRAFTLAALWSVAVNAIGAATFGRAAFQAHYASDRANPALYHRD